MFKIIGGNIKLLRTRKKLSQSDLGAELDLTRQQISNYEKGDVTVPLNSIVALSTFFKIPIDFLIKLNLQEYSDDALTKLLEEKGLLEITQNSKESAENLLDTYFKNIVKEQLKPMEDLMRKILIKIDLTDLKYELSEEINKVNSLMGENHKKS